jgi:hypothetical protein
LFSRFQIQKHQTEIFSSLRKIQAQHEWGTSPLHKKRHINCIGSRSITSKQDWFWNNKITTSFIVGFLEGLPDLQQSTISWDLSGEIARPSEVYNFMISDILGKKSRRQRFAQNFMTKAAQNDWIGDISWEEPNAPWYMYAFSYVFSIISNWKRQKFQHVQKRTPAGLHNTIAMTFKSNWRKKILQSRWERCNAFQGRYAAVKKGNGIFKEERETRKTWKLGMLTGLRSSAWVWGISSSSSMSSWELSSSQSRKLEGKVKDPWSWHKLEEFKSGIALEWSDNLCVVATTTGAPSDDSSRGGSVVVLPAAASSLNKYWWSSWKWWPSRKLLLRDGALPAAIKA